MFTSKFRSIPFAITHHFVSNVPPLEVGPFGFSYLWTLRRFGVQTLNQGFVHFIHDIGPFLFGVTLGELPL